jgi:uncharacterized protein YkwD
LRNEPGLLSDWQSAPVISQGMLRSLLVVAFVSCVTVAAHAAASINSYSRPATNDTVEMRVKRLVDRYRAQVGLLPVTLDAKLSKGCMEHARYMLLNKDADALVGLNAHHQRPNLRGASAAGAACGKAADLFFGVSGLDVAVDGWMSTLYHRRPILTPTLERIGVGYAKLRDGSYMAALMFVDSSSADVSAKWPVAYPADKQGDVPLEFGDEVPNPVPGGARAGYPITIQFPPFDKVTGVRATLVDGRGKDVAFYLSDPEHPATTLMGQYGVVCLIPKLPLRPESHYEVRVDATWNGKAGTWRWSFTTLALRPVDAHDEGAVRSAINVASTLRGTALDGGMMVGGESAFLRIGLRTPRRYKTIVVLIPRGVWGELGGNPDPFVGRTVEVDGTPHLFHGSYINIPITVAGQLRIVPERLDIVAQH